MANPILLHIANYTKNFFHPQPESLILNLKNTNHFCMPE